MRPESIRKFDLFFLASLAVSLLATVLGYDSAMELSQAQGARSGVEVGSGIVNLSLAIGLLIPLLLWYLVSRKGFAIAKWLLVLLFLIGVFGSTGLFAGGLSTFEMVSLAGLVLQAVAIWYLFQPDAKAWFSGPGEAEAAPGDPVD